MAINDLDANETLFFDFLKGFFWKWIEENLRADGLANAFKGILVELCVKLFVGEFFDLFSLLWGLGSLDLLLDAEFVFFAFGFKVENEWCDAIGDQFGVTNECWVGVEGVECDVGGHANRFS